MMIKLKSGKMSVSDTLCVCLFVEGGWGVDGGSMPLPTYPQQYCDPALHVSFLPPPPPLVFDFLPRRVEELFDFLPQRVQIR